MPWRYLPTKDVTSCEKLRRDANNRRPADIRMEKSGCDDAQPSMPKSMRREPGELKHLSNPEEKKSNEIPQVAASEQGRSPNR